MKSNVWSAFSKVDEDIKYCGYYESQCYEEMTATKIFVKLQGMMHQTPVYTSVNQMLYMGDNCNDKSRSQGTIISGMLKPIDDVSKKMVMTVDSSIWIAYDNTAISNYICTEPLELNVEYDVTKLDCKNDQGEDVFKRLKEMIGTTMDMPIVFAENYIVMEEGSIQLDRVSDEGCRCYSDKIKKATEKFVKSLTTQQNSMKVAPTSNEDIKYCGNYESGCGPYSNESTMMTTTIQGMMHQIPVYSTTAQVIFNGNKCDESARMIRVTLGGMVKPIDSEHQKWELSADSSTITFYDMAGIADYKCSEPLRLNVEYDVTKLECKDSQGNDPFKDLKEGVGQTTEMHMKFDEDSLEMEGWEMNRVSDDGCRCYKSLRK